MTRLPPGRHKLSRQEVRDSQLGRLRSAAAEALLEEGYARVTTTTLARRAGVSTATLYRHHGDLWACLLDAYEAGSAALCERVEAACVGAGYEPVARVRGGVEAAMSMLAAEPALAQLLCAEPPATAVDLWDARRELIGRLATLLAGAAGEDGFGGRQERLVAAALRLVAARSRGRPAGDGRELAAILTAILSGGGRRGT